MNMLIINSIPIENENDQLICKENSEGQLVCYKGVDYSKIEDLVKDLPSSAQLARIIATGGNHLWVGDRYEVITEKGHKICDSGDNNSNCEVELPKLKDGRLTFYVKDQNNGWIKKVSYQLNGKDKPRYEIA